MKLTIKDLTKKQKENARKAGYTLRDAVDILNDAREEERLERLSVASMGPEEREAYYNL